MRSNIKFRAAKTQINRKIYKYYNTIHYAKDCIENRRIHFEKIESYNDIFDGSYPISTRSIMRLSNDNNICYRLIFETLKQSNYKDFVDILDERGYDEMCSECISFEEVINKIYELLKNIKNKFCPSKDNIINAIISFQFGKERREHHKNISCSCFSEVNNSLLMWSYYADCHKGVCLEFDLTTETAQNDNIVKNIGKVNYSSNYSDTWTNENALFTKSIEWNHEQEWRIVADMEIEEYLPFPYVTAIYLGARISEEYKKDLTNFAKKHLIDIYQLVPNLNKFELDIISLNDI